MMLLRLDGRDAVRAEPFMEEMVEYNRQADLQLERMRRFGIVLVLSVWIPVLALWIWTSVAG